MIKTKKYSLILFIILAFFLMSREVLADTKYAVITIANGTASLRNGPSTSGTKIIAELDIGTKYELVSDSLVSGYGCTSGWYNLKYNDTNGYVCASLVSIITVSDNTSATSSCEKQMESLGFPQSYWGGLCSLAASYPNWNFVAINTGLDWSEAVKEESSCGKSFLVTSVSNYIDSSCNKSTSSWKAASQQALAYYMDPRNWLNEKYIFQFNYLKYDNSLGSSYPSGVKAIIQNASFYKYHLNLGNDLANITNTAGSNTDVNPTFLASRMLQELGSGESEYDLYSGVYTGNDKAYYGYYNFFNYGVPDSCEDIVACGLSYAYAKGWSTPLKAIEGTSSLLSTSYISVGQYTSYLQKFNVVPTNTISRYLHQYMTNIAAPSSESVTSYNSYKTLGILNNGFTFYIPVYNNMDAIISNSNSGAVGDISTNTPSTMAISTIVTTSGYKYSSGYLMNIGAGVDVSTVISSIEAISGTTTTVKNSAGKTVSSGNIGTGYKVVVTNNATSEELTVVIKGDVSGDGEINALDLLKTQKNILGISSLSGAYAKAADVSGEGTINALDLLKIQKHILGVSKIS